ncbi:MAG TPA: hypothetical protein PLR90_02485 [Methylophilus sp.]|nr:hypothetical protein [Methylophilus sp.]HQQ32760.1 hypothetical protein [Methylophilus sp.]
MMVQPLDTRFPKPIQKLWTELHSDVVWLHGRWIIYRQLFGTSKERVDLLNESAGTVTWILQQLLLHDVQLALSKIGDPAGTGAKKNLTLRRLQADLSSAGEAVLTSKLEPLLEQFENSCVSLRDRRNKWIAHSDLATKLAARATPLSGPSRTEIEVALAALRGVMNCVELHYTDSQTAYEQFIMDEDGEHLLMTLARAKRYRDLVAEKKVPKDDLRRHYPRGV